MTLFRKNYALQSFIKQGMPNKSTETYCTTRDLMIKNLEKVIESGNFKSIQTILRSYAVDAEDEREAAEKLMNAFEVACNGNLMDYTGINELNDKINSYKFRDYFNPWQTRRTALTNTGEVTWGDRIKSGLTGSALLGGAAAALPLLGLSGLGATATLGAGLAGGGVNSLVAGLSGVPTNAPFNVTPQVQAIFQQSVQELVAIIPELVEMSGGENDYAKIASAARRALQRCMDSATDQPTLTTACVDQVANVCEQLVHVKHKPAAIKSLCERARRQS